MSHLIVGLLPTHRYNMAKRCLESLKHQKQGFPILVLTQGFTLSQQEELEKTAPAFADFIHFAKVNETMGWIRNELFQLSPEAEFYFIFDDDFIFGENALGEVIEICQKLQSYKEVGACFLDTNGQRTNIGDTYKLDGFNYCKYLKLIKTDAGIVVRKDVIDEIKGIDSRIALRFELYLAVKIFAAGYDIVKTTASIEHRIDPSTSHGNTFTKKFLYESLPDGYLAAVEVLELQGLLDRFDNSITDFAFELHLQNIK